MILHSSSPAKCKITAIIIIAAALCSCTRAVIIPAGFDAALCSAFCNDNISGQHIHGHLGLGGYNIVDGKVYTFPAAYIGSNKDSDGKDAIALGGFDLSLVPQNFSKAVLKLYINYAADTRYNMLLFVRPITKPWSDTDCTFGTFYRYDRAIDNYTLRENVCTDESRCVLAVIDIAGSSKSAENAVSIPFAGGGQTISINITDIIKDAITHPDSFCGLLLDPMWHLDHRYRTVNARREISDSGVIQAATSEWFSFDETDADGIHYMHNHAKGKLKFVPRIEIR